MTANTDTLTEAEINRCVAEAMGWTADEDQNMWLIDGEFTGFTITRDENDIEWRPAKDEKQAMSLLDLIGSLAEPGSIGALGMYQAALQLRMMAYLCDAMDRMSPRAICLAFLAAVEKENEA